MSETAICGHCGKPTPPRPARELWKGCAACEGERCGWCGKAKADAVHDPYRSDEPGACPFLTEREARRAERELFFRHGARAGGMRGSPR